LNPEEETAGLVLVNPENGAVRDLVDLPGVEATPRFSPDGRTIAFSFFPAGSNSQQLYLVDAGGSNPRALTSGATYDYSPNWSPDGSQLVFVRDGDVSLISAAGGDVETLTTDRTVDHPVWSPDGAWIAFVEHGRDELQLLGLDDRSIHAVPELFEVVANPVWPPSR
jgi:TolB protein